MTLNAENIVLRGLFFLFTRFPFANGLTMLMLLSERASRETYPPFEPKIIYVQMIMCLILGVAMSMNIKRKDAALVYAGQVGYSIYLVLSSPRLQYRDWLRARICLASLGALTVYVYFAYMCEKGAGHQLRKVARCLLATHTLASSYALLHLPEEGQALDKLVSPIPGLRLTLVGLSCVVGLALLMEYRLHSAMQVLTALTALRLLMIDLRIEYWQRRMGVDFWCQVRIALDTLNLLLGLGLVIQKKRFVNQT